MWRGGVVCDGGRGGGRGRGIHAGDAESYDTFIDIYRPCVERYHTGFKWDAEHAQRTDLSAAHVAEEVSGAAKGLIVSSRIRVARNLAAPFVMNPNGTAESRRAVLEMVRKCVETFPADLAGRVYAHAEMTAEEEQRLIDDHILFKGRDARQAACGYHQYWPAGRGVFCSEDRTFNMWINEGDHLRIMCLFQGSDIKGVLGTLERGIGAMEAAITEVTGSASPIAKHPILGCVTCCPTNLGTGCRASVMMDLPRLMRKLGLHGIDEVCGRNQCQARGSTGEFSEVTESARCDISNRYRLGYSEAELVSQMIRTANLLAQVEARRRFDRSSALSTRSLSWLTANLLVQMESELDGEEGGAGAAVQASGGETRLAVGCACLAVAGGGEAAVCLGAG